MHWLVAWADLRLTVCVRKLHHNEYKKKWKLSRHQIENPTNNQNFISVAKPPKISHHVRTFGLGLLCLSMQCWHSMLTMVVALLIQHRAMSVSGSTWWNLLLVSLLGWLCFKYHTKIFRPYPPLSRSLHPTEFPTKQIFTTKNSTKICQRIQQKSLRKSFQTKISQKSQLNPTKICHRTHWFYMSPFMDIYLQFM